MNIFLLHNFPTPYRNYLFEELNKACLKKGIFFEVHFYSQFDKSRPDWNYNSEDLNYPHRFWKTNFRYKSNLHLNLGLIKYIGNKKPDWIIIGGLWSSINSILLTLFRKSRLILWDEVNRFDFGSVNNRFYSVKRYLANRISYFAIPGYESYLFYSQYLKLKRIESKIFLSLPNIIDETLFNKDKINNNYIKKFKEKYNIDANNIIIIWPARHIPDKGILEFINHIDYTVLQKGIIILLGKGLLTNEIESLINVKKLNNKIILIDYCQYNEMVNLYHLADIFILPSISDSNPLSIVEAIHCELPILVSNRIGNIFEVIEDGINGYIIDPFDISSVRRNLSLLLRESKESLKNMGLESKRIAMKNFSSKDVVSIFIDRLIELEVYNEKTVGKRTNLYI